MAHDDYETYDGDWAEYKDDGQSLSHLTQEQTDELFNMLVDLPVEGPDQMKSRMRLCDAYLKNIENKP